MYYMLTIVAKLLIMFCLFKNSVRYGLSFPVFPGEEMIELES